MIKPPSHLTTVSKKLWNEIITEYELDDSAGLAILRVALEAFDLSQAARKEINKTGLTVLGRDKQLRANPLLTVSRDSRAAFLAGLKALNLNLEPLRDAPGRPPLK